MIRILYFGLSTNLGGIETYLHKLANNIDKNKFQLNFLVSGKPEEHCFYKELKENGSRFFSVTPRSENLFKYRSDLKKIFTHEKIDILHCNMNSLSNILPITLGLKYNKPVIVHSRNGKLSRIKLKTKLLHEFNSIRLPQKSITKLAVSDVAGQWMFGEDAQFKVINNGVNICEYKYNEMARRKIRKNLNIEDDYCIVHVGAFRNQKNHFFLLEVFYYITQINPKSKLILVGSGRLKEEIIKEAKELGINNNVIMVGSSSKVSDYLSAGDAFLFPSFFEGFPNAVLEAQTSGLPCLISDTITTEVLINRNCVSFPLNKDAEAWAKKITELPPLEKRIAGANNVKEKGFSVDDEVTKIESVYIEIIKTISHSNK